MKTRFIFLLLIFFSLNIIPADARNARSRNAHSYSCANNYCNECFGYAYIPNLTPKQKHRIDRIYLDRDRSLQRLTDQRKDINRELRYLERRSYANKRGIDRLRNKLYKIDKDISKIKYKADDKVYSLLTQQQRHAFVAYCNRR